MASTCRNTCRVPGSLYNGDLPFNRARVPRTAHQPPVQIPLAQRAAPVGTGVVERVEGPTHVEEGQRAPVRHHPPLALGDLPDLRHLHALADRHWVLLSALGIGWRRGLVKPETTARDVPLSSAERSHGGGADAHEFP